MVFAITSELYDCVTLALCEAIGGANYFSGSITLDHCGRECTLTASLIVYRTTELLPEGPSERIDDLVPVWWEFSTVGRSGGELNDFSFSQVRRRL